MDRRVKERLVGATILVVLVVLIVPELLSGPKRASEAPPASLPGAAEPIRNVTVDLATSKATAATEDAGAPAAATEVASAAGDVAASAPLAPAGGAASAPPQQLETQQAAIPPAEAIAKAEPEHHGWEAQLGSFAARGNAERLERQLRDQGFSPSMSATGSGVALRYRVRVGPVSDRAAAERLVAKLKQAGHPAIVAP